MGAVHEHPKTVTFFLCRHNCAGILVPIVTGTRNNLMSDKNSIGDLTSNSHTKFWISIFPFLKKWHNAYLWRVYTKAEVSHPHG